VDLISYTIAALSPVPEFKEAAPGSGGLCGGTFLNRVFASFLKKTFGNHRRWSEEVQELAMQHFEREKKAFTDDPDDKFVIPISPLDNSPWIVDGKLIMSSANVAEIIFEPVVSEVIKLVKSQIRATKKNETTVQAVVLVGGFGENIYLRRRLKAAVGNNVRVIGGHNG
jgi:hypothetical protein